MNELLHLQSSLDSIWAISEAVESWPKKNPGSANVLPWDLGDPESNSIWRVVSHLPGQRLQLCTI